MIARVQTELPNSAEKVWRALRRRDTLLYITQGVLEFRGAERWPEIFEEGTAVEAQLVFFHLIPGWKHELRIVTVDDEKRELVSEESGGIVRQWNHRVQVERMTAQRCRYTDEIEIKAGGLTVLVWAYAQVFYRYRQRRWQRLARTL